MSLPEIHVPRNYLPETGTDSDPTSGSIRHLRQAGVSILIDETPPYLPAILYWGADLGELDPQMMNEIARGFSRQSVGNSPDDMARLGLLPENSHSWIGTPGLEGHRDGRAFSTRFRLTSTNATPPPQTLVVTKSCTPRPTRQPN